MSRRPWPFYPVLFALYSPLALAVANLDGVTPGDLVLPLLWSTAFALLGWVVGRLVTTDRHRAALLSAAVVAFLSFGGLISVQAARLLSLKQRSLHALLFEIMVVFVVALFVHRSRREFLGVTRFLNFATTILFVFLGLRISSTAIRSASAHDTGVTPGPVTAAAGSTASLPDIYYIVLDSYSSGRELLRQYGHDQRGFETALRERGFVVPQHARANYVATFLSLASSLNWTYMHDVARDLGRDNRDRRVPYRMIERNRASQFLKKLGYEIVFLPTSWPGTRRNRGADSVIFHRSIVSDFQAVWFDGTAMPFVARLCRTGVCRKNMLPIEPEGAAALRWKFQQIGSLPGSARPKFVIAHMMLPHEPFVFRRDCSVRETYWPRAVGEDAQWRAAYREQVACTNQLLLRLVDSLMANSTQKPIIILQGDHGHGRFPNTRPPALSEVTREQIEDRTHVFAAYHMPKVPPAMISDSITPVNVWPLLLTHYFATPTPALPDQTYWSAYERPYDLTRIH